jgi:hypothetical protein
MSRYESLRAEYAEEGERFDRFGTSGTEALTKILRQFVAWLEAPADSLRLVAPKDGAAVSDLKDADQVVRFLDKHTLGVFFNPTVSAPEGSDLDATSVPLLFTIARSADGEAWRVTVLDLESGRKHRAELSVIDAMRLPSDFTQTVFDLLMEGVRDRVRPGGFGVARAPVEEVAVAT